MSANPVRTLRRALCAAVFALAACGVGSKTVPVFDERIIGPAGGSLENDHALCQIPAGAFGADTVCAMVPQPDPLPIDPSEGQIDYLPGLLCIGPRGQALLVPGFVRFCYDPADIPFGSTEADLVLLEWDDVQGFMVVPATTQDTTAHCFEDFSYDALGYLGVGVRVGPPPPRFNFVFFGAPPPPPLVAPQGIVQALPQVVLANDGGLLAPLPMDGTEGAFSYLPSFDGSRVMFTVSVPQFESSSLSTVDVAEAGPFVSREVLPVYTFSPYDPLYGWLGTQDRVYHEREDSLVALGIPASNGFSAKAGDGTGVVVDLLARPGFVYLEDVRVSPDRTKVLLRWADYTDGFFYVVDVIDATDGTPIGLDLPTSTDSGDVTPRWLPDSSGLYFVEDDGVTVTRIDPDGSNAQTLYSVATPNSALLDFVVAPTFLPDPQRCAFVRRDLSIFMFTFGQGGGPDYFETDTLAGDDLTSLDLGDFVHVDEMVPLFSDGAFQTSLVLVSMQIDYFARGSFDVQPTAALPVDPAGHTLVFSLSGGPLWADIPAPLSHVDVSRVPGSEGQMLVWIETLDDSYPEYPSVGVYHLDAFAGNPVDVTPAGWTVLAPPRWLQSWRLSPGFDSFTPRVR